MDVKQISFFSLLLLIFFFSHYSIGMSRTIVLNKLKGKYLISPQVFIVEDQSGYLIIEDLSSGEADYRLKKNNKNTINIFSESSFWIQFKLTNQSHKNGKNGAGA